MDTNKPTSSLTHLTPEGHAHMVDIGAKDVTSRRATARARVSMSAATFERLASGDTPKGDVLAAARIAGIQAAKRTSELIPLCHLVFLTHVEIAITLEGGAAIIDATAEARDRTGVEMEAMVAASTAALTLYDMLKAVDRGMTFDVCLTEKTGGKSGTWQREPRGESGRP
jgi:cyclic pyranopterin monophosphate synthase